MGADFTPIGGGRIGKAEAFEVLANALGIEEQPISEVRLSIFHLLHDMGEQFMYEASKGRNARQPSPSLKESWDLLGMLYAGLAELEAESMKRTHDLNLKRFQIQRAAEAEQEDAS